jgi:L-ascorbate metabolism protein UlaG (beta-lactamase superfamily)
MKNEFSILAVLFIFLISFSIAQYPFETDTITTSYGDLIITFIGHGTLMFSYNKMVIHIDPVSQYADYTKMPKADIILVTHHHGDHLDKKAIAQITKEETDLISSEECTKQGINGIIMKNGDERLVKGLLVKAVPAYNIVHKRDNGQPFHPKGIGNGYVIKFGDKKIYVAGDTENVPEMKNLSGIDYAFLPMNVPYTMTPGMVAEAVRLFHPKVLYPYHYGDTNVNDLLELLKDNKDCEVRIRKMQ